MAGGRATGSVELADEETMAGGPTADEWLGLYRKRQVPGERVLQLAVLEDALRTLRRRTHTGPCAAVRGETLAWLRSDDARGPFDFVVICEAFDLDPGRLRKRVEEMMASTREARQVRLLTRGRQQQPLSTGGNWHTERAARRRPDYGRAKLFGPKPGFGGHHDQGRKGYRPNIRRLVTPRA